MKTVGIILSGGRGERLGGADKGLLPWMDETRVESVISRLCPQVDSMLISCNRNLDLYARYGLPLVQDKRDDYQGPLAGLEAALELAKSADFAVVVPCDCPEPPADLAERLSEVLRQSSLDLSFANDGKRDQYLFTAMRPSCLLSLSDYLDSGQRSVKGWHRLLNCTVVDFSDQQECFANMNDG